MTDIIYVAVTMDCEPLRDQGIRNASGPVTWRESELSIRGYDRIAREYGFPVTYFQHPEVALAHADLMRELERGGACIDGLHLHPWKFDRERYNAHFGGLSASDQCAILSEGSALFRHAMGKRPKYFRPGTFSANDDTFRILSELGFVGGSVSAPERNFVSLNAIWNGAPRDPHRPDANFRQRIGALPFANVPLTSDFSSLGELNGRAYFRDLRPDYDDTPEGFRRVVANVISQVRERKPLLPVVNMVTHNDNPYSDPDNQVTRNYRTILEAIHAICEAAGVVVKGVQFDDICTQFFATGVARPEAELA
ncbi:polysaccharide deacetylase family protein [Nitratireductor pacificus]|uniref:Chitooligosaccharide deacetylase n=1 Tax=Nitratireductor pacificus pht-3B TaxID=391937 RepID=K2MTF6_9HYPH|nr:polysaccharide deacetylase family protein [Nitratireductor pacificus]EKF20622.1 hypothetical protein NA2_02519 [Nitratireductor pacificus pht-3B]